MPVSGAIKVLPSGVREYSTATDLDPVTRLATNPADSSLRSVLVRIRCETPSSCRSSSPLRYALFCRQDKIPTVHLPLKMGYSRYNRRRVPANLGPWGTLGW